jgi:hypothetical protein
METKWLIVQSFERSQTLLEAINKLIIHLKLTAKGVDDRMAREEVDMAFAAVRAFLKKLGELAGSAETKGTPITGIDVRYRKLVRNFVDAKGKSAKYKSVLFKQSPQTVLSLMDTNDLVSRQALIDSLAELGLLLEDHVAIDARELIGEI